jgi:pantoate--beta-alanine ligase
MVGREVRMSVPDMQAGAAERPLIVRDVAALRAAISGFRARGERVALIPTLGALHEGHLALVRAGQERAERAVVSIFVNPTQFGPHEDVDRYPRTEAADLEKLRSNGADSPPPSRWRALPRACAGRSAPVTSRESRPS